MSMEEQGNADFGNCFAVRGWLLWCRSSDAPQPMTACEEELTARALLADPAQIDVYLKEKRWAELAALVRFARRDVPMELAQTDPALYRQLREQITRFFLRGRDVLSLCKLEMLARD